MQKNCVLIVAGSDSGGGAGIQGDIRAVNALGGYAMTAITAVTSQSTMGVRNIHKVPPSVVSEQIDTVLRDMGADSIKTGMLLSEDIILAVVDSVEAAKSAGYIREDVPIVVDTVMRAKDNSVLTCEKSISVMRERLFPLASLVTPNIPEAEIISCVRIRDSEDMVTAARAIRNMGASAVLVKGGHGGRGVAGEKIRDALLLPDGEVHWLEAVRQDTRHTHGTGCAYASAIATLWGRGDSLVDVVTRAHAYVQKAIRNSPRIGKGRAAIA